VIKLVSILPVPAEILWIGSGLSFCSSIDKSQTEIYRGIIKETEEVIEGGKRLGIFKMVDSNMAASLLLAALDGLLFQSAMGIINIKKKNLARNISNTFLEGLKK